MKINLDPHPDEHEGDDDGSGMDFETLRPKIESLKYINFGNHMTYTERSGVDIFTSASHLRNTRFVKALIREITGISMHSLLAKSRRLVAGFHGDIALTIDNDLLKGFPVRSEFIHPRFSVTAAQVVSLLEDEDFMRKISMLDMGGLVHEIPDFNLREDIRLDKPPSMKAMIEFVRIGKEPGAGFTDSQKGMIDAIGSYVAMYHMRAINAYAMAHALP
jgi:hypothetical protein